MLPVNEYLDRNGDPRIPGPGPAPQNSPANSVDGTLIDRPRRDFDRAAGELDAVIGSPRTQQEARVRERDAPLEAMVNFGEADRRQIIARPIGSRPPKHSRFAIRCRT